MTRPGLRKRRVSPVFGVVLCAVVLAGCEETPEADTEAFAVSSREAVTELGASLMSALHRGIADGGPVAAISVCNEKAPQIAAGIGAARGIEIGRTSLKVRNPANAPDAWERETLLRFEDSWADGDGRSGLEHMAQVSVDGRPALRYMKAIPTGALCLQCHGKSLDPDVRAVIEDIYPEDQAQGYAAGDLRGAFTVIQWLD